MIKDRLCLLRPETWHSDPGAPCPSRAVASPRAVCSPLWRGHRRRAASVRGARGLSVGLRPLGQSTASWVPVLSRELTLRLLKRTSELPRNAGSAPLLSVPVCGALGTPPSPWAWPLCCTGLAAVGLAPAGSSAESHWFCWRRSEVSDFDTLAAWCVFMGEFGEY